VEDEPSPGPRLEDLAESLENPKMAGRLAEGAGSGGLNSGGVDVA
jgi:hypothetical protein